MNKQIKLTGIQENLSMEIFLFFCVLVTFLLLWQSIMANEEQVYFGLRFLRKEHVHCGREAIQK